MLEADPAYHADSKGFAGRARQALGTSPNDMGRSRQPVDYHEFSDDRAWAKDRQYPLVTLRRSDADL
jgi:hypothetical protein